MHGGRMAGRVLAAIIAATVCCGCYDRFDDTDPFAPTSNGVTADGNSPNISIAELHQRWNGKTIEIEQDLAISGRVTSSDRAGNFYRTFTIADHSGGAEVWAGAYDLYNIYPIGCEVIIRLNGCAMTEQEGVLQIGLPAAGWQYSAIDYFQSSVSRDRHILRSANCETISIPVLKCSQLRTSECGMPVTVEGLVRCTEEDDCLWEGYVRFEDSKGGCIYTTTSSYADFAQETLPDGRVAITGILRFGTVPQEPQKQFILKMRSREDCRYDN